MHSMAQHKYRHIGAGDEEKGLPLLPALAYRLLSRVVCSRAKNSSRLVGVVSQVTVIWELSHWYRVFEPNNTSLSFKHFAEYSSRLDVERPPRLWCLCWPAFGHTQSCIWCSTPFTSPSSICQDAAKVCNYFQLSVLCSHVASVKYTGNIASAAPMFWITEVWHAGTGLGPNRTGGKPACVVGMSSWPQHLQASTLCHSHLLSPGASAYSSWPP